jgi:hypothetical protein
MPFIFDTVMCKLEEAALLTLLFIKHQCQHFVFFKSMSGFCLLMDLVGLDLARYGTSLS